VPQVAPAPRQVRHLAADGSLVSSGMANAISIQLAGSWLPLEDMAGEQGQSVVELIVMHTYSAVEPNSCRAMQHVHGDACVTNSINNGNNQ
jgi:hypothetical protein